MIKIILGKSTETKKTTHFEWFFLKDLYKTNLHLGAYYTPKFHPND